MSPLLTIGVPIVLLAFVAAEIGVRVLAPRLPKPLDWHFWEAEHKVAAIEQLGRSGGASVAMIGSSIMNSAVDAELLSERLGVKRPVFSAGLNAATARTIELWTLGVVLPNLRPDLVVFGLNTLELNDGSSVGKRSLRMFEKSFGWRRYRSDVSRSGRVFRWLEEHSNVVRFRRFPFEPTVARRAHPVAFWVGRWRRDPLHLFRRGRGKSAGVSKLGTIDARWYGDVEYHVSDAMRRVWSEQFVNDYNVGGVETAAFRRLVDGIRAAGASLLVVLVPATSDWIGLHAHGESDVAAFDRALAACVAEWDLPFVDLTPALGSPRFFADPIHLNGQGMSRFAEELTQPILELIGSRRRSPAGD